jgi:hypothetical protein
VVSKSKCVGEFEGGLGGGFWSGEGDWGLSLQGAALVDEDFGPVDGERIGAWGDARFAAEVGGDLQIEGLVVGEVVVRICVGIGVGIVLILRLPVILGCFGAGFGVGEAFLGPFLGFEVGGGSLDDLDEEAGAFEVHLVAGEAGGDLEVGLLDVVAGVEAFEQVRVVGDDGGDVLLAVLVAHELVVHGGVAAAVALALLEFMHALMRLGWFAPEVFVSIVHGYTPPGGMCQVVDAVEVAEWYIPGSIDFSRFEVRGVRFEV